LNQTSDNSDKVLVHVTPVSNMFQIILPLKMRNAVVLSKKDETVDHQSQLLLDNTLFYCLKHATCSGIFPKAIVRHKYQSIGDISFLCT